MRRLADLAARGVLPLALVAVVLALVVPSPAVADRSGLVLAALVLITALGVDPRELKALRGRWRLVSGLVVLPFVVLAPVAWAIGQAFTGPVRDGALTLGLAPTEVATAGLVALALGDAALVLAAVVGSLVVSALLGPVVLSVVAGAEAGTGELVGSFALVVLVPLIAGVAIRSVQPRLREAETVLNGAGAIVVSALVYAALSGAEVDELGSSLAAAAAFLAVSGLVAAGVAWARPGRDPVTVPLTVALRDFAVAAALAEAAFGSRAASVAGVYGVLMLVAGAVVAGIAGRRAVRPTAAGSPR